MRWPGVVVWSSAVGSYGWWNQTGGQDVRCATSHSRANSRMQNPFSISAGFRPGWKSLFHLFLGGSERSGGRRPSALACTACHATEGPGLVTRGRRYMGGTGGNKDRAECASRRWMPTVSREAGHGLAGNDTVASDAAFTFRTAIHGTHLAL